MTDAKTAHRLDRVQSIQFVILMAIPVLYSPVEAAGLRAAPFLVEDGEG